MPAISAEGRRHQFGFAVRVRALREGGQSGSSTTLPRISSENPTGENTGGFDSLADLALELDKRLFQLDRRQRCGNATTKRKSGKKQQMFEAASWRAYSRLTMAIVTREWT